MMHARLAHAEGLVQELLDLVEGNARGRSLVDELWGITKNFKDQTDTLREWARRGLDEGDMRGALCAIAYVWLEPPTADMVQIPPDVMARIQDMRERGVLPDPSKGGSR